MSKKTRITVYDIAKELNISPSTVTRSLNNQTCISQETRMLVHETAERLGYRKNMLAHGLRSKPIKIGIILRNKFPEYQNLIIAGAKHACNTLEDFNTTIEIALIDVNGYDDNLLKQFDEFCALGCDGIVFTPGAYSSGEKMDALISEKKVKASTFLHSTDLNNTCFNVGVNNKDSGRIAADLLALAGLKKGDKVAYFTSQRALAHHKENLNGFMEMNQQYGFQVQVFEHQDNEAIAYYAVEQLLHEQPNIKGIFCSTAVTLPICQVLLEMHREDNIVLIGTELLSEYVPYIEKNIINAVIFQNPYKLGYLAYKNMYELLNGTSKICSDIYINPQIVIRGNVSFYEQRITKIDTDS